MGTRWDIEGLGWRGWGVGGGGGGEVVVVVVVGAWESVYFGY
jgi:hypothetical protein